MKYLIRSLLSALVAISLLVGCQKTSSNARAANDTTNSRMTQETNTATAGEAAKTGAVPSSSTPAFGVVQVVASEYALQMPSSIPAGPTRFEVRNSGREVHSFKISGNRVSAQLGRDLGPGQSGSLQIDLQPGTYEVECPIDGHAGKGMKMQVTVAATTR